MICFPTFAKTYGIIHLVSLLAFKHKQLRKEPKETLIKALKGYIRSLLFILGYCVGGTATLCSIVSDRNSTSKLRSCKSIFFNSFLVFHFNFWMFFASAPLALEAPGRRLEIFQYQFPRYLESIPVFLRKRKLFPQRVVFGSVRFFLIISEHDVGSCAWNCCLCPQ